MMRDAPLKVLHVGKFYPPHPGGMESHLQTLCEELSKSIEVEVLVASDRWRSERSTQGKVELVRLATALMLHGTPIVPLMARAMRQARPDVVHLHFPNPMAALACLMSRLDVPIVVTWHSDVVRQRRAAAAFAPLLSHAAAALRRDHRRFDNLYRNFRSAQRAARAVPRNSLRHTRRRLRASRHHARRRAAPALWRTRRARRRPSHLLQGLRVPGARDGGRAGNGTDCRRRAAQRRAGGEAARLGIAIESYCWAASTTPI